MRVAEVREAVDFCRYYASEARRTLAPHALPGPTGESERAALSRARRVRVHQPVEFPALDLHRPGRRRARRRQYGGGEARRADAADRCRGRAHPARGGRAARTRSCSCPATARSARRWSPTRAPPASPSPARPRWRASSTARSPRKDAPIVPLIAETGGINAMIVDATALPEQVTDDVVDVGVPLRRPALLGAAAAVRAGGRRRPHHRDDRGRGARTEARRPARAFHACRAGDRRRGEGQARPLDRRQDAAACASAGTSSARCRRAAPTCAPTIIALDRARDLTEEVFGPILHVVRWRADDARRAARRHRRQRLRAHARHSFAHRRDDRAHRRRVSPTATSTSTAA